MTPPNASLSTRLGYDAVTALCLFVGVMLAMPSSFIVSQLGSIGSPATILGLIALLWWCWHHLHRRHPRSVEPQPIRWAIVILAAVILASYVRAMSLPISADEVSPADTSVIRLASLCGIALVANDGIRNIQRMHRLTRFLVIGVGLVAAFSVVQFITGDSFIDRLSIPGFTRNEAFSLDARQGLVRPSGTATHPIEFSALISMTLPLAIMRAKSRTNTRLRDLLPVALIALGVALSLSRTAILCTAVAILFIFPSLPRNWRIGGAISAFVLIVALYVTVPGMVGTLRGLFSGLSDDPSVQSRTDSYALASEFLARSPFLGHGPGTFLPKYWILDNMYLQFTLEIGILGVAAILGIFATAIVSTWRARRILTDSADRDLAIGLSAGVAAGATSFAFFDALAFPQASFGLFLLVGMSGALWRIATPTMPNSRQATVIRKTSATLAIPKPPNSSARDMVPELLPDTDIANVPSQPKEA